MDEIIKIDHVDGSNSSFMNFIITFDDSIIVDSEWIQNNAGRIIGYVRDQYYDEIKNYDIAYVLPIGNCNTIQVSCGTKESILNV